MVKEKEEGNYEKIKAMSDILFELQLALEPIRDKALDEKARLTGYSQCAEQMIKIIVTRAEDLKKQAEEKLNEPKEENLLSKEKLNEPKEENLLTKDEEVYETEDYSEVKLEHKSKEKTKKNKTGS